MSVYEDAKKVTQDEITYIEVTIDGVTSIVPNDVSNRHYNEMMELVKSGDLKIADAD